MPTSTAVGREEAEACVSLLSAIERGKYLIRRPHETYNIEEFGPQCMSQRANYTCEQWIHRGQSLCGSYNKQEIL
jgi:hypothetical protein